MMEEAPFDQTPTYDSEPLRGLDQPISGTYVGQRGSQRLELRLDLREPHASGLYPSLNLVSGDLFRDVGGGWDYYRSFIIEHPEIAWKEKQVSVQGAITYYGSGQLAAQTYNYATRQQLRVTIPLQPPNAPPPTANAQIIYWGFYQLTFLCDKTSDYLRAVDLEIDRIKGTELPQPFHTHTIASRPPNLPRLDLDIAASYRRAGIDMRIISENQVLDQAGAGPDLKWNEDELHNAMAHHFSQWKDLPQWKVYLLIATHFRLYPQNLVTGIMYDSQARDPNDPCPRQGAAAFYSTIKSPEVWANLPPADFDRNYLRTCVHELGHTFNLLHPFDCGRPASTSWMNYPWRYPYGYDLPPGWQGTQQYWRDCRYEFDIDELRHLRHEALLDVIPGGAAFGASSHSQVAAAPATMEQVKSAPVGLYVRTRPERTLFEFAEPITVEIKLENQTAAAMIVPDMLKPEFGLMEVFIRNPRGQVQPYAPLFKLCGEARHQELPPGEKLFESVFLGYGAQGFYFQEPGEYQIWAIYTAGGLRLRSNVLGIRVAYPQSRDEEQKALFTFGDEQGHLLYMRGGDHLRRGTDELREITERYPTTHLARYIHYCLGSSQAREFKDTVSGRIRPPQIDKAIQQLTTASTLLRETQQSALDNITHGRVVDLLYECYQKRNALQEAEALLIRTVSYFQRMQVKKSVIADYQRRIDRIRRG